MILSGLALLALGMGGVSSFMQYLGVSLGTLGILFLLLGISALIVPILKDFIGIGKILLGIVMLAGGWFSLFPPEMSTLFNGIKGDNKNTGALSFMSKPPTPLGLERQPSRTVNNNSNIIDQTLWEIMNADTSLAELMRTDSNLAGKIQSTKECSI